MNIHEFWKAVLVQDENEIRKYFHEDAYVNWHCTNEHFNLDEYIIANCEYPGEWNGVVERTEEMGNLLVTVANVYPKDKSVSFHVTSFIKLLMIRLFHWMSIGLMIVMLRNGDWISILELQ